MPSGRRIDLPGGGLAVLFPLDIAAGADLIQIMWGGCPGGQLRIHGERRFRVLRARWPPGCG